MKDHDDPSWSNPDHDVMADLQEVREQGHKKLAEVTISGHLVHEDEARPQNARERLAALFMPKPESDAPKIQFVPNRSVLRSKGIGVTRRYGKPFARITSSTRAAPCHLDTYYSIYFKNEAGKTVKKVVIRKDMFDKSSVTPYVIQKGRT